MTKLIWLLVLACVACRLMTGRWPWQLLDRKPSRLKQITIARRTLGVSDNSTRQDIIDAHRRLVAQVHPDRGGSSERVHEANDARDLLLNNLQTESRDHRP